MEPTLVIGTRVIVEPRAPKVGEIVVLYPPAGFEHEQCGPAPSSTVTFGGAPCDRTNPRDDTPVRLIKRIVAGPGDEIYIGEGHVYRKARGADRFAREPDPYIQPCGGVPECDFPTPIEIPAGHWYVLGDNRGESDDSRFWGPIPTSWILGVVTACDISRPSERTLAQIRRYVISGRTPKQLAESHPHLWEEMEQKGGYSQCRRSRIAKRALQ